MIAKGLVSQQHQFLAGRVSAAREQDDLDSPPPRRVVQFPFESFAERLPPTDVVAHDDGIADDDDAKRVRPLVRRVLVVEVAPRIGAAHARAAGIEESRDLGGHVGFATVVFGEGGTAVNVKGNPQPDLGRGQRQHGRNGQQTPSQDPVPAVLLGVRHGRGFSHGSQGPAASSTSTRSRPIT